MPAADALLSFRGVSIRVGRRPEPVVCGIDLDVERGAFVSLVGESGSGKSLTALSVCRLLRSARIEGSILFRDAAGGIDLVRASERDLGAVRGRRIAYIFQDPGASLNPVLKVGAMLDETLRSMDGLDASRARQRSMSCLERVELSDPGRVYDSYPHELSGGMKQRVMIAAAMLGSPALLIADEPTTALDVTTEAQVLRLIDGLRRQAGMTVLFITHDLGVAETYSDKIAVLRSGSLVETMHPVSGRFEPAQDYTRKLFGAAMHSMRPKQRIPL